MMLDGYHVSSGGISGHRFGTMVGVDISLSAYGSLPSIEVIERR